MPRTASRRPFDEDIVEMDRAVVLDPESPEEILHAPMLQAFTRDHKDAARALTRPEVRWLVDTYYKVQEYRIAAGGQMKSAGAEAPNAVVNYLFTEMRLLEGRVQKALDLYVESTEVGKWLKSIYGIGPVIAAGLMAHIEIERSATAGAIWRFAGLDSTVEWHGSKAARELIKSAFVAEPNEIAAVLWVAKAVSRRPLDLFLLMDKTKDANADLPSKSHCVSVLKQVGIPNDVVIQSFQDCPLHVDNAIKHAIQKHSEASGENFDVLERSVYSILCKDGHTDQEALIKFLAKRPWNADLKRLCWLAGQSFMKFSGRDACYYGKIYRERKEYEIKRNESGGNEATAAGIMAAKRFGTTTQAYGHLKSGKLPPAQIDARARRYAVKLFLAHMHEIMFIYTYGENPPKPYPIAFLGHVHKIDPPNKPEWADLKAER